MRSKPMMPGTGSLLQAIQRLVEATYKIRMRRVHKSSGLNAINRLRESTVKTSILDVKLMYGPVLRECQRENDSDSCRLDHWTESLLIINTRALSKTPENPAGLVPVERPI
jgi:hypothetical protein